MIKVIFVVTNEPRIAGQYFAKYKDIDKINIITENITNDINANIDSCVSAWIEETSLSTNLHFITESDFDITKINVVFLPYSGLAYTILKSRVYDIELATSVVCINEKIATQASVLSQFNVLLNGKYYPPFSFFIENLIDNGLKSSIFDETLNLLREDKIKFIPEDYKVLLGQIAND